jgi:diaminopimelate epimerase
MAQVLVIAAFLIVFLRESISRPLLIDAISSPRDAIVFTLGGMALLWVIEDAWVRVQARRLNRWGLWRAVASAEQGVMLTRVAGIAWHGVAVLGLGWLDAVRAVLDGNALSKWPKSVLHPRPEWLPGQHPARWIVVDTLLAVLPLLALVVTGWWSFYRIDRRLREATLLREIEQGTPVIAPPTRAQYVLAAARHQLGLVLIPILLIATWNGIVDRVLVTSRAQDALWMLGVRLAGSAVVLALMPFVMRRVWDTVALGPGPLRDRLLEMCRIQRVRVREVLVWRTGGAMINGAVMGFFARARYILLTDALLEHLPLRFVEAVTAHELGHVRRKHMLWLAVNGIGAVMLASVAIELAVELVPGSNHWPESFTLFESGVAIAAGLIAFGFASRRFEWQADAFAVQHLSAMSENAGSIVEPEAVTAMSGALDAVARLNHIPRERFTWRHGSIASRQRRLAALVGKPIDRLKPDRDAGFIKLLSLGMLIAAIGALLLLSPGAQDEPSGNDLMRFVKMEGAGNDYVYLDAVREPGIAQRADLPSLARHMSDRHRGIGSDGLILICHPTSEGARQGAQVRMRMFNADGSESEMCGNGVRCVAKFAHDRLGVRAHPMRIETGRGVLGIAYEARAGRLERAAVDMGEPILEAARIPVAIAGRSPHDRVLGLSFRQVFPMLGVHAAWMDACGLEDRFACVSMGNPHLVLLCRDPGAAPLETIGPMLERASEFPNRVNVHLVRIDSRSHATMRTWERGAGLTLACGTGACAVHVACVLMDRLDRSASIAVPGGELSISWDEESNHVLMSGPARDVFEGDWPENA